MSYALKLLCNYNYYNNCITNIRNSPHSCRLLFGYYLRLGFALRDFVSLSFALRGFASYLCALPKCQEKLMLYRYFVCYTIYIRFFPYRGPYVHHVGASFRIMRLYCIDVRISSDVDYCICSMDGYLFYGCRLLDQLVIALLERIV